MTTTSTLYPADRLDRARTAAAAAGLDALLITPGADLRYLTGYEALPLERLTCLVLPARGPAALVVPKLEMPRAVASPAGALGIEVVAWDETDDPFALCARLLDESLGSAPAGVGVADRMWAVHALRLRAALPGADQSAAGPVLRELRMRKSAAEVEALRVAGAAIDRVHERIGEWLRPGRTEREVGGDIAAAIVAEGHTTVNFVIVGSGPNGASPHHDVGDRVIERGDAVVGLSDHLHVALAVDQHSQPGAHDPVVVGDQDADHSSPPSRIDTVVPQPGAERTWSSPPTSRARSAIPPRPSPMPGRSERASAPGSKPAPSSRTRRSTRPSSKPTSTSTAVAPAWRPAFVSASCVIR